MKVEPGCQVVGGIPQDALPRVVLMVRSAGGNAVATWEVVTAPSAGPPRRVHHATGCTEPIQTAFQQALAYAEREGIRYLCILDPGGLFPKSQWTA